MTRWAKITNAAEVETGIREAAAKRVEATQATEVSDETVNVAVVEVVTRDARWTAKSIPSAFRMRPADQNRLAWIFVEAYAAAMIERLATEAEEQLDAEAEAVKCMTCGKSFVEGEHFDLEPESHPFTCPHGHEVTLPEDCLTDH